MSTRTITLDVINGGPSFTSSPTVPTPAVGDNSQNAAPTTFVAAAVAVEAAARASAIASLTTTLAAVQGTANAAIPYADLGTPGNPFALDAHSSISGQTLGNNHSGYPTFASLSNFPYALAGNNDYVDIPCFATTGDYGHGRFIWNATSTAIAVTGFIVNPTGNTGAGRLIRLLVGNLRLEMAGGIGDNGTTDNSPYFTIINSFISANSSIVGQYVLEFNGLSFGTSVPWTPHGNLTPQNGKLLAMAGSSWSSTNGVMNVSNSNIKPFNFIIDCGFIANVQGLYLTSTSGFNPNGLTIQRWSTTGGNGLVNNGGKVNNSGPVTINQYTSGDAGYTEPWLWTGYGLQNIGVADCKFQQFVISKCAVPIFFDENCFNNTISCCHPYNGGPTGVVVQNAILVDDRGNNNVYIGNEFDQGSILLNIDASSTHKSPPTVNAVFVGNTWLDGATSAYPAHFRFRTTLANTTINNFTAIGTTTKTNTTMPNVSFEPYGANVGTATASASGPSTAITLTSYTGTIPSAGMVAEGYGIPGNTTVSGGTYPNLVLSNSCTLMAGTIITFSTITGSFNSNIPTALMSAQTGPFSIIGGNTNVMSNYNFGGYGSVYGNLTYPATITDMGRITTAQDSNCTFFINSVNKPVILSASAPQGQKITVTGGASAALVTTATTTITYGSNNVGNGTLGSLTMLSGAALGNYLLTALTTTTFSVVDPNGTNLGTATVGVAFTSTEIDFTIIAGLTAFAVADAITVINNTGTASLNDAVGGSISLPLDGRWEFECVNNGTGTNASWAGSGNIIPTFRNRSFGVSGSLNATDINGSILVNAPGVTVTLPNYPPPGSFCVIATNSTQGCSIISGSGAKIQNSSSAIINLPNQNTVFAFVINNAGNAANWGIIGIPVVGSRLISSNTPLLITDSGTVLPINNGSNAITITLPATFGSFAADTCIMGTGSVTFVVGSGGYLNGVLNGSVTITNGTNVMTSLRITMQYNPDGATTYWFVK